MHVHRDTHRQTHKYTQTDTQLHTDTNTHTDRDTNRQRHTQTHTNGHAHKTWQLCILQGLWQETVKSCAFVLLTLLFSPLLQSGWI
jgi:hypothetical protein